MKIKFKGICRAVALGAALFSAWGCNNQESAKSMTAPSDENPNIDDAQSAKVRDYILSLGFTADKIVSEGDNFIVDGDIAFNKSTDYTAQGGDRPLAKGAQYAVSSLVSMRTARNIRVRLNSDMPGEEANLDAALLIMNRTFSDIFFQRVTSTNQHILLRKYTNTPEPSWTALAQFPSGGNPGPTIQFNFNDFYDPQVSNSLRQRIIVHELMHCIGVAHNQEDTGSGNTLPAGTLVPNTPPYNNEEPYGIMHAPSDWFWNGKDIGTDNALSRFDHMTIQYLYPHWRSQKSGDVNGDSKTDIILIKAADNSVSFKLSNGTGLGTTVNAGTFGDQTGQYMVGDINGDKKTDLLFAKTGSIQIRYSNGNGFNASQTLVTGFGSTAGGGHYQILDFNGDGKSDVLFVNFTNRSTNVRLSNGSGLGSNITKVFGDVAGQYFTGDFNGDNKDDIMCANRPTNLANDPSTLGAHTVSIVYSNGTSYGASSGVICGDCFGHISWSGMYLSGDYNKDGRDDIYFKDINGHVHVALSTGSSIGQVISNFNVGAATSTFFSGDFNGDGRTDIMSANRSGGISLLRSNGSTPGSISAIISSGFGNASLGDLFF